MNEDIRISLDFWDHHKTIRLKKKIGYEGIEALTRLWFYAAKFRPRGHLTNMDNEDIAVAAHWNGDTQEFMNALTDSKHPWLDWYDDHYYIHNWHKRNPYASYSEKRSEIAKKAAEKRWNKKHNKKQKDNAVSNADFKEQQCSQQETAYAPIPIPIPNPYSKNNGSQNSKIVKTIFSKDDKCPHKKIIALFQQELPDLQITQDGEWGPMEQGFLREVWDSNEKYRTLDFWRNLFIQIRKQSPFLCGKKTKFKATLGWIVIPDKFKRILRGDYFEDIPKPKKDPCKPKVVNDNFYSKFTTEEHEQIDKCTGELIRLGWPVKKINTEVDKALRAGVKPGELLEKIKIFKSFSE